MPVIYVFNSIGILSANNTSALSCQRCETVIAEAKAAKAAKEAARK